MGMGGGLGVGGSKCLGVGGGEQRGLPILT